ncbi:MAG: N-acetylmuramoyl-L-alanine amidase, partial [Gemmatimonadetes bacterium]|nr:N-acetylmuramoyl-L-alanine amidase [Gemmatimonadota bacterium]
VRPGEGYQRSVRASAGAVVRAILGDGDTLNFQQASPRSSRAGSQVVGATPTEEPVRREGSRYVAWHVGSFGPDPGHVMSPTWRPLADDSSWVTLEVIRQADTARSRWPLRVGIVDSARPPLALVADDTAGTGATDRVLAGRPVPFGTYHWFFPNGTVIPVSGRSNAQVRLQLSRQSVAWVDASDVLPVRPGTPLPRAVAGSMRLVSDSGSVTLRVPLSRRVPFRVDETERSLILRLYGSAADMDWIRYGGAGPFVRLVSFHQPAEDEVEIRIDLDQPVWGYRTRWSGNALLLQIRRPPAIEQGQGQPFRGRRIAIDAGHPPAGSLGPRGITEAEVTLAVSRKLRSLLEERGADVVMIRDSELGLGLVERSEIAERSGAELLVSIHANAMADGANPFASSGTTVFYYHPRSVGLARGINDALVRQLGFRDLGVARGDLHLARPTWMPAVLVEGLFMMIPEHEAVLLSEEGQWRYAHGVLEGIGSFLEERAGGGGR